MRLPASSRPATGMISSTNWPLSVAATRLLVAGQCKAVLLFAADTLCLRKKLGRDAHHEGTFAGAGEKLRVEIDARIHGDVVHVLQPAHNLHIFGISQDRVRRLRQRLQTAAAESVHRRPAGFDRQSRHQSHGPGHVEALLALLLRVAEHNVLNNGGIDSRALDERTHHGNGQVVGTHIAKRALLRDGHDQSQCDNNQR